ncbi:cytochrome b/b6 domain-containing protein [Derxia lacustris]|uniref:cytochrome b/b6 domain-containing protein n=1 Tax=Derxia lacustris TaxID=764842 RepID=UPI000A17429D|nr:cytochrome b/b6 domain-containing protein [Derxia lacustris]
MNASATEAIRPARRTLQPAWVRATHWLNVVAVVPLAMSGWRIYDASPFFDFEIPRAITLGGWLGGAIQWHFAAMWLLVLNGLLWIAGNAVTGRWRERFWPLSPRAVLGDLFAFVRGKLSHDDLAHYNGVQRAAYVAVALDLLLLVLSGLVLWKSVQFPLLRELLGGYELARRIHFLAMAGLVGFVAIHLVMVALVPRSLRAMTLGR